MTDGGRSASVHPGAAGNTPGWEAGRPLRRSTFGYECVTFLLLFFSAPFRIGYVLALSRFVITPIVVTPAARQSSMTSTTRPYERLRSASRKMVLSALAA